MRVYSYLLELANIAVLAEALSCLLTLNSDRSRLENYHQILDTCTDINPK
ncbi:MAG: hypothetical protein V7L00_22830 [Nostoc sp.]|nr:hypothetical protein [Nostoc sp. JL33]MBN3869681.1 hypothetical protein [Nostoc sp. JL33]